MNANELADIADGLSIEIPIREWIDNEPKNIMNDIATMLRQQQAEIEALKKEKWLNEIEIEALKKEKWLNEIDAKQQALKNIIDWLTMEHDTLACTSYPIRKAQEK